MLKYTCGSDTLTEFASPSTIKLERKNLKDERVYLEVPPSIAKQIADVFEKSAVIICSKNYQDILHITTYGTTAPEKAWAADGGEKAAKALGALNSRTMFEDYRLQKGWMLLTALNKLVSVCEDHAITPFAIEEARAAVRDGQKFFSL